MIKTNYYNVLSDSHFHSLPSLHLWNFNPQVAFSNPKSLHLCVSHLTNKPSNLLTLMLLLSPRPLKLSLHTNLQKPSSHFTIWALEQKPNISISSHRCLETQNPNQLTISPCGLKHYSSFRSLFVVAYKKPLELLLAPLQENFNHPRMQRLMSSS